MDPEPAYLGSVIKRKLELTLLQTIAEKKIGLKTLDEETYD